MLRSNRLGDSTPKGQAAYITEIKKYTGIKGSIYLANKKIASLTTEDIDVQLIAAIQVLGIDIHVYHKWGKEYKWLKFPCINWDNPSNLQGNEPG